MGSRWREVRLGEIYEFRSGLSKPRSAFGSGYGFLTFKDVFYNTFTPERLGDLVESTERERELCSIRRGDVFLTRTSETQHELGMSCVALRDYESATFNGFCKRLRPKAGDDISPEYAAYYFRGPNFRRAITAMSSLSTRASLNEEMLGRLTISLPPYETQIAIGKILKTFDDKIALNRRTNETLEAIARALFKSWFIDFDPVHAKMAGREPEGMNAEMAALFPDSFEESDFGPVPRGWRFEPLDAVARFLNGLALQKYPANDGAPSLPVIKIAELRRGNTVDSDRASVDVPPEYVVVDGDVLFSWSGSLTVVLWSGGRGALNQHLFKVTSSRFPRWLYFRWVLQHLPDFQAIAADKATTMGHIQRGHLTKALVAVPPPAILERAGEIFEPLDARWLAGALESRTLAELRDSLLPRLLSGELSVAAVSEM
jgi:type I restriction enzyme S subunit